MRYSARNNQNVSDQMDNVIQISIFLGCLKYSLSQLPLKSSSVVMSSKCENHGDIQWVFSVGKNPLNSCFMLNNSRYLLQRKFVAFYRKVEMLHKDEFLYIVFFLGKTHQLTRMPRHCNTDILDNQRLEPQRWHLSVMSRSMKYFIDR